MRRALAMLAILLVAPASASFEERFGHFAMTEGDGTLDVEGRHLRFTVESAGPRMTGLDCLGRPMVGSVEPAGMGEVKAEALNRAALVDGEGNRLVVLQDDPRCSLQVMSTEAGRPMVVFPGSLDCSGNAPVRCAGDDHVVVMHVDGTISPANGGYLIDGHATILATRPSSLGAAYDEAVEQGRVGAEVAIGSLHGFVLSQSVTVGDMRVEVTGSPGNLTARIASDDPAGRAITFELDPQQYTDPNITVFEIHDGQRTAVATVEVGDVDALFATSPDRGIPVLRANGSIIVYFHHYSEKEVNIEEAVAEGVRLGIEDALRDAPLPLWALLVALAILVRRR